MPFGKAKFKKSHHQDTKNRQKNGDISPKQDEFLHYYRQYRHPNAVPQDDSPYNGYSSGRRYMNTSPESEYEFGSCYSSLGRFPSTSSVTGILPSQLPPPQLNTMQSRQPVSPNGGLGELSGMLAAKMSFGHPGTKTTFGNGSVDEMARRRNFLLDDAQSRDSGHLTGSSAATNSSSESPRFRPGERVFGRFRDSCGHLLRRRPPPKQLSLDSAERLYNDRARKPLEWNNINRNDIYPYDERKMSFDRNSVYSFNTAVDERDSGVSGESVVSYMDYNPVRHFNRTVQARTNGFGDSVSVQSSQTGALFADLDDNDVDVDDDDDQISNAASWSPWMSTASTTVRQRRKSDQSDGFNDIPPNVAKANVGDDEPSTLNEVLSKLFSVVKLFLSVGCCTLLCLALFVASRSLTCRWTGFQKMDVSTLDAVLKANIIGQNLALSEIVDSLQNFYQQPAESQAPVLVLYLLGLVGTGKTLTTSLIRSQFPVSSNVHVFSVPVHFASGSSTRSHLHILDDLAEHVKRSCGYSLVIFEDVEPESISPAVSGHLSKFIQTLNDHRLGNGTIVVITSNIGGQAINQKMFNLGNPPNSDASELLSYRERMTMSDVVDAFEDTATRIPMLETLSTIGVTIRIAPFLPLTRDHVRQCIVRELASSGGYINGAEVNDILDDLSFFSDKFPVFSKTGCKKVSSKVDLRVGSHHTFLGFT